jgi:DNA-binding transcriptional ArsR family regulator
MTAVRPHTRDAKLDRVFRALSDPTRRALLMRLRRKPGLTITELGRPFPITMAAVLKHLDVLSDAGLVGRTKKGRTVSCTLKAAPMKQAVAWLNSYEQFWSGALDRLAAFAEENET